MENPNFVAMSIEMLGGLVLFLYGMGMMTESMRQIAGDGLRRVLGRLTTNRFTALLTGASVTAVVQSSSITTVLVVGFISAGLLSLSQSVGVIMGANIGTTITAQMIAFKITTAALPIMIIGFTLDFFSRASRPKQFGRVLLGFGLIFFGMEMMSDATSPLRTYEPFIELMERMRNPLLGILVGATFTALVQSSSATTGIVIVMAGQGVITLDAGIALILGSNVGTCITSILASIGKPREAKQAAAVHVLFNVAGVMVWIGFISLLADVVRRVSPASTGLDAIAQLAADTPRQVANAHTIFNIANTLLFIWFTGPIAALVKRVIPDPVVRIDERARPQFLDAMFLSEPGMALDRVRLELVHLGALVMPMVRSAVPAAIGGKRSELQHLARMDDDVDSLHASIYRYIGQLSQTALSPAETATLNELMEILNALEAIGDTVETNIVPLGVRRVDRNIMIRPETRDRFQPLVEQVAQATADAVQSLETGDLELAHAVIKRKGSMNHMAEQLLADLARQIIGDSPDTIEAVRIEIDLLEILKRTYYFSKRIAKAVVAMHPDQQA